MNANTKMKNDKQRSDFQMLWNQRKQEWRQKAAATAPDDNAILHMADLARHRASTDTTPIISITKRRNRWIPYAAAASIAAGITLISVSRQGVTDNTPPTAQKVNVEGNTMFFMCNNGCSVQDVVLAANDVIKK
ncbi:MAG: hypothetical protein IJ057_05255 [Bacteroidales bacterium]|nr:hypothetical protein [Bacteroidales bacterium]